MHTACTCILTAAICTLALTITLTITTLSYSNQSTKKVVLLLQHQSVSVSFIDNSILFLKYNTFFKMGFSQDFFYIFLCTSQPQSTYEIMPLWNIQTIALDPRALVHVIIYRNRQNMIFNRSVIKTLAGNSLLVFQCHCLLIESFCKLFCVIHVLSVVAFQLFTSSTNQ